MVETGIRGKVYHTLITEYAKANNKYMKYYDENKESSYFIYWNPNNLYRWAMSQKLPLKTFKRVKVVSKFDKSLIKCYNEESDKEYFIEVDVQYPENLHNFYNDLLFLLKRMKIEKVEKLLANLHENAEQVLHKNI